MVMVGGGDKRFEKAGDKNSATKHGMAVLIGNILYVHQWASLVVQYCPDSEGYEV